MNSEPLFDTPAGEQWRRLGVYTRHGIDLSLSSLHTANSCGIGEFLDLLPLIDWCHELKMGVIQLLPLNDSGMDPSPYYAISACALNPLYISLYALPNLDAELKEKLAALQQPLQTSKISFAETALRKLSWLFLYFQKCGQSIAETSEFKEFFTKNTWLVPYSLFREQISTFKDHLFYVILQYICSSQMLQAKEYASSKGVLLKGDIPILVSSHSADALYSKKFFNSNFSAGAPPDAYNREGQYWGVPLFNWDALKQDNYYWWKERLHFASNFYDLYRIDHVVGFFRIWGVPLDRPPKEGRFFPEDRSQWIPQGREILEMMLSSSPLLPIAEDLGNVPKEVRICLTELGICGTKVMRWERIWDEDARFIPFQDYPRLSLTTVSTHDSETLQIWWKEQPEEAKAYAAFKKWTYAPDLTLEQRKEILWDSHHTPSLFHINLLQEYLAYFPELVWPNPEDERINIPGKTLPGNWTYRLRPSIEELRAHDKLKDFIKGLIA